MIGPAPDNNPAFKSPLEGGGKNSSSNVNMVMNSNDHDDDYGDLIANEVIPDTYSSLQRGPRSRGSVFKNLESISTVGQKIKKSPDQKNSWNQIPKSISRFFLV